MISHILNSVENDASGRVIKRCLLNVSCKRISEVIQKR